MIKSSRILNVAAAEFAARLANEQKKWGDVISKRGIKRE